MKKQKNIVLFNLKDIASNRKVYDAQNFIHNLKNKNLLILEKGKLDFPSSKLFKRSLSIILIFILNLLKFHRSE